MEGSTAEVVNSNTNNNKQKRLPPTVITVDTSEKGVVANSSKQQQPSEETADRNDKASKPKDQDSTAKRSSLSSSGSHVGTTTSASLAAVAAAATSRKQNDTTPASTVESESRTPKHANKAASAHNNNDGGEGEHGNNNPHHQLNAVANSSMPSSASQQHHGYQQTHQTAFFPPRIGGHTTGAFQPAHERMAYQQQQQHAAAVAAHQQHASYGQQQQQQHNSRLLTLQLSPGTGRYYASFAGPGSSNAPPPGSYGSGPSAYEQHQPPSRSFPPEYSTTVPGSMPYPPQQQHAAQVSGMYPHQQYTQQGYSQRQPPPPPPPHGGHHGGWAQPPPPPPPAGTYGRPPTYPSQQAVLMAAGGAGNGPVVGGFVSNGSTFSRAVSSSFDRSIKSRNSEQQPHPMDTSPHMAAMPHPPPPGMMNHGGPPPPVPPPLLHHGLSHLHHNNHGNDGGSVSDEGSWQQLNQIQSVDEEEMQKRLAKRTTPNEEKQRDSESNSSSLTNSPTGEVEHMKKRKDHLPDPPKMTSSLDSLSSVASAQEPLDTSKVMGSGKGPSPSEGSLDLMKCASSSSAFILPAHQRHISHLHLPHYDSAATVGSKRGHDESRGDIETVGAPKEIRKDPPAEDPRLPKKGRMEMDPPSQENKNPKSSPLSIACSPPVEGGPEGVTQSTYFRQPGNDSFYDKPPSYSYSMDSAPPLPMNPSHGAHHDAYPPLPAQSHSSDSSTVTPMHLVGTAQDHSAQPLGVTQLPSWEIQGQESFGGGSQGGGNPLMSTFSFSHDYPMLSGSNSGGSEPPPPNTVHAHAHHHHHRQSSERKASSMETRNQSFEGGHYHGSFNRAETMSFDSRSQGTSEPRQGYQGSYPPHAPSWGSAGSYPPPHQSSVSRSSYPHPPPFRMPIHSTNMMRAYSQDSSDPRGNSFQPPSEFQAPPSNLNKARNRKEILSTPYVPSKTGVFGWTKEEDMRLTDIMKKYKNPRDWEPIAKELDRNRTAKECHERWIRYLKPGVRKGQWTDQEDAIVMEAVTSSKEQPFTRWSDLAQRLPGRVGKQIRDRWVNHLNPNINHLPFSREDDLLLWNGHQKVGKRWVEIATKFFKSSRSENHIKNRWYSASFKKFISNEFGPHAYSGSKSSRSPKKDGSDGRGGDRGSSGKKGKKDVHMDHCEEETYVGM